MYRWSSLLVIGIVQFYPTSYCSENYDDSIKVRNGTLLVDSKDTLPSNLPDLKQMSSSTNEVGTVTLPLVSVDTAPTNLLSQRKNSSIEIANASEDNVPTNVPVNKQNTDDTIEVGNRTLQFSPQLIEPSTLPDINLNLYNKTEVGNETLQFAPSSISDRKQKNSTTWKYTNRDNLNAIWNRDISKLLSDTRSKYNLVADIPKISFSFEFVTPVTPVNSARKNILYIKMVWYFVAFLIVVAGVLFYKKRKNRTGCNNTHGVEYISVDIQKV